MATKSSDPQSVSPASHATDRVAYFITTIGNAKRLMEDAKYLNDAGRSLSSIILGVLAIEELGKALIVRWGVRNEGNKRAHPSHVEKQSATFALLSANELMKKNKKGLRKMVDGKANFLTAGPLSHQFAWARSGFYDDLRLAATYADENPKIPNELKGEFGSDLADELLMYFRKAYLATRNVDAMSLAATFYKNDLGRL